MTLYKSCLNCDEIGEESASCTYDGQTEGLSIRVFQCGKCGAVETVTVKGDKLK